MDWLAIKSKNGEMFCQSRKDREAELALCITRNIPIGSVVERQFWGRRDAENFCERINRVNKMIAQL